MRQFAVFLTLLHFIHSFSPYRSLMPIVENEKEIEEIENITKDFNYLVKLRSFYNVLNDELKLKKLQEELDRDVKTDKMLNSMINEEEVEANINGMKRLYYYDDIVNQMKLLKTKKEKIENDEDDDDDDDENTIDNNDDDDNVIRNIRKKSSLSKVDSQLYRPSPQLLKNKNQLGIFVPLTDEDVNLLVKDEQSLVNDLNENELENNEMTNGEDINVKEEKIGKALNRLSNLIKEIED
ncbi:hypothetical protein SNEBB_004245 [Seison nebaliae]|nr:hypothetical protein SNEBB_004245 [Seison nebaliae]